MREITYIGLASLKEFLNQKNCSQVSLIFKNLYVINFSLRITFKKDPNSSLGFEASIQILFTVLERRIWFIFCTFDKLLKNIDV